MFFEIICFKFLIILFFDMCLVFDMCRCNIFILFVEKNVFYVIIRILWIYKFFHCLFMVMIYFVYISLVKILYFLFLFID